MSSKFGMDGNSGGSPAKIDETLTKAQTLKDAGNVFFAHKEYRKAIRKYSESLLYLRSVTLGNITPAQLIGFKGREEKLPEHQLVLYEILTVGCHNNISACHLSMNSGKYEKIVEHCEAVLKLQPNNAKAHRRRGEALYKLKDHEKALASLLEARRYSETSDPLVAKHIDLCQRALATKEADLKSTYQRMFRSPAVPSAPVGNSQSAPAATVLGQ